MNRNTETPAEPARQSAPPAEEYELPEPPVPPCTPEEYDAWFRAKVQEALDDPDPILYSQEEAMVRLDTLLKSRHHAHTARAWP